MSETTNYGGVDLTRHPALKEAYRIACLIEACGASPELTTASSAAFDFVRTLNEALPASSQPPKSNQCQRAVGAPELLRGTGGGSSPPSWPTQPPGTEPADAERYQWLRRYIPKSIIARIRGVDRNDVDDCRPEALDMLIDERLLRAASRPTKGAGQ